MSIKKFNAHEALERFEAKFSQSRNDMNWSHWDSFDGFVRWTGYDDAYWWENISVKPEWRIRVMESGKSYELNPETGEVFVTAKLEERA